MHQPPEVDFALGPRLLVPLVVIVVKVTRNLTKLVFDPLLVVVPLVFEAPQRLVEYLLELILVLKDLLAVDLSAL